MNPAASAEKSCQCRGCWTFLRDCAETEFKGEQRYHKKDRKLMHVEASPSTLPHASAIVFGNIVVPTCLRLTHRG